MKKLSLMLAFVLVFALVLVACGDETETSSTPATESSAATTESSAATTESSAAATEESSEAAVEESSEAAVEESSEAAVEESSEPEEDTPNVEPGDAITTEGTNVALNASYNISGTGVGHGQYTANLTDGQANGAMAYDNSWFAFYCNGTDTSILNAPDKQGYVIIDLGSEKNVNAIRINFANNTGAGISSPEKVAVSFSADGSSYTKAGNMPLFIATKEDTANDNKVYWSELEVEGTARYVKIDITLIDTFVFLNEIEVYA